MKSIRLSIAYHVFGMLCHLYPQIMHVIENMGHKQCVGQLIELQGHVIEQNMQQVKKGHKVTILYGDGILVLTYGSEF